MTIESTGETPELTMDGSDDAALAFLGKRREEAE